MSASEHAYVEAAHAAERKYRATRAAIDAERKAAIDAAELAYRADIKAAAIAEREAAA